MKLRMLWAVASGAALASLALVGCGGSAEKKPDQGGAKPAQTDGGKKIAQELKVIDYSGIIKGRVTFGGSEAEMKVTMIKPTKDQDKCPKELPQQGWYVKDAKTKGIQYAVVFLRAPRGTRLPKPPKELEDPKTPEQVIRQPHCQFEPRVVLLHPKQKLRGVNDSQPPINHDVNISGTKNNFTRTLPPGQDVVYDLQPDNSAPNNVLCAQHQGMMSGYVWKFDHPWAVVTNENGEYELQHVPVVEGGKLLLVVWHEMLPKPGFKEVGEIELKPKETLTRDITLP